MKGQGLRFLIEFWICESILVIAAVLIFAIPGAPDMELGRTIAAILAIAGFRTIVFATAAGGLSNEHKEVIERQPRLMTLTLALLIDVLAAVTFLLLSWQGGRSPTIAELTALQKFASFVVAPLAIVAALLYSPRFVALVAKWKRS